MKKKSVRDVNKSQYYCNRISKDLNLLNISVITLYKTNYNQTSKNNSTENIKKTKKNCRKKFANTIIHKKKTSKIS